MLKKQFNKLRFEWRSLNKEFKSIKKIQELALPLFTEEISKHIDLNKLKDKEPERKKESKNIFEEPELKIIFRELAKETHPDKGQGKEENFSKISKAKRDNKLNIFLEEARKLNKNNIEITYDVLEKIEKEIIIIKKDIHEITNSFYWVWYFETAEKREEIIKTFIKNNETEKTK